MLRLTCLLVTVGAFALDAQTMAAVQVTRTPQGAAIPKDFLGLSIQQSFAINFFGPSTSANTVVFNLLKNLGGGTLRIGGATADDECWSGAPAPDPSLCIYTLTGADFQSWSNASGQTGWPMLIGVNLVQNLAPGAPQYVLSEVTTGLLPVIKSYPRASLLGLELGNELNLYSMNPLYRPPTYGVPGQITDLLSYMNELQGNAATKSIMLAAPAYYDPTTTTIPSQLVPLIAGVTTCTTCSASNLGLVTLHEYPLNIANGVATITNLLSPSILQQEVQIFQLAVADSGNMFKLKVQIDETNSTIPDPGQTGVSDVQASALWALDYALAMARLGVRRMNFHIHEGSFYDPIQVTSPSPGVYSNQVEPEYYAMYAFTAAKGQQFLPVTVSSTANVRAYALSTCATCAITVYLINKDLAASGTVTVSLSTPGTSASYFELAAPSLSSYAQNVTYGGVQINAATGLLSGPVQTTPIQPDGTGSFTVNLDNAAAGILTIQP